MDKPIPDGYLVVRFQGAAASLIPYGSDKFEFKDMGPGGWKVDRDRNLLVITTNPRGHIFFPMENVLQIRVVPNRPEYREELAAYTQFCHAQGQHDEKYIAGCFDCTARDIL